jgi:hypothetical protein
MYTSHFATQIEVLSPFFKLQFGRTIEGGGPSLCTRLSIKPASKRNSNWRMLYPWSYLQGVVQDTSNGIVPSSCLGVFAQDQKRDQWWDEYVTDITDAKH